MRLQFLAVERGDWAPVPGCRERRDDAQALFTFGCGWRAALRVFDFLAQLVDLLLELGQARPDGIAILAARRAIGHEPGTVVDRIDRHRLGRECRRPSDRLRHPWSRPNWRRSWRLRRPRSARAPALRSRSPRRSGSSGGACRRRRRSGWCRRASHAGRWSHRRRFGTFADDAEAMVEEEALADLRAGMDVDACQEAREMVDQPRKKNSCPSHSQWASRCRPSAVTPG